MNKKLLGGLAAAGAAVVVPAVVFTGVITWLVNEIDKAEAKAGRPL